jgi:hypothetical protein
VVADWVLESDHSPSDGRRWSAAWRLLDDTGAPGHWVEVDTPDGQWLLLARAVAEEFVTVDMAVAQVTRRRSS